MKVINADVVYKNYDAVYTNAVGVYKDGDCVYNFYRRADDFFILCFQLFPGMKEIFHRHVVST